MRALASNKGDFQNVQLTDSLQELRQVIARTWGYTELRPYQQEAMSCTLDGRDSVVVLPTGGGKSLCFQAPALINGPALVISPLIALMQDQVTALRQYGVSAACLNSSVSSEEMHQARMQWRSGELRMLYVAPERAVLDGFLQFLQSCPPKFIAVDEAHCISQWGHDFRPEYRRLRVLREKFPAVPITALTATATTRVREDIARELDLREPDILVGNFDRPNLQFRVERRGDRAGQVEEILRAHTGESGIIYCITRKDTEGLTGTLVRRGFRACAYHAGLSDEQRRQAQNAFQNEEVDAIVATIAFGMGIDRSNVRFVIHAGMPRSIENYQQEAGRAGRDGLPAECVLLYSPADTIRWRSILESSEDITDELRKVHFQKLKEIDLFTRTPRCRHRFLVEYFGQQWQKGPCDACDVCVPSPASAPANVHPESTVIAQKILSCVLRLKEQYGSGYVTTVLRGDTGKTQPVHCGLSTFGLLSGVPERTVRGWIDECLQQDLLARTSGEYPVLKVTDLGWQILRGQGEVLLTGPSAPVRASRAERITERKKRTEAGFTPEERRLFEALRSMRLQLAQQRRCPAYMILPDSTLAWIAGMQPSTLEDLVGAPGMGERKRTMYGEAVLKTVRACLEEK